MNMTRKENRWRVFARGRLVHGCFETLAFEQGYRVCGVCEALGLTERQLQRIFIRDVGLSPKDWMQRERMVVARRMLAWGLDVLWVSERLGFSHVNSFRREFLSVYGVGPARFVEERGLEDG